MTGSQRTPGFGRHNFYSHASSKQKHNQIQKLNDADGNEVSDKEGLRNLAKTYFEGLFAASTEEVSYCELSIVHVTSVEENSGLVARFLLEEFTGSLRRCFRIKLQVRMA